MTHISLFPFSLKERLQGCIVSHVLCQGARGNSTSPSCFVLSLVSQIPSALEASETEASPLDGPPQRSEYWKYSPVFSFPPQKETGSLELPPPYTLLGQEAGTMARSVNFPTGFSAAGPTFPVDFLTVSHKGLSPCFVELLFL